jgi:hypothetical protein
MKVISGQLGSRGTKASVRGGSRGASAHTLERAGTTRITAPFCTIRRVYILTATAFLRSGPCSDPLHSELSSLPPLLVLAGDGVIFTSFVFSCARSPGDETLTSPSLILILCRVEVNSAGFHDIQRGNLKSLVDLRFPLCSMVISRVDLASLSLIC